MTIRLILTVGAIAFVACLLLLGIRAFSRWMRLRFPERASVILAALWMMVGLTAWLTLSEFKDQPTYRPHDLLTLQEPLVAKAVTAGRDNTPSVCLVDAHEHVGVLSVEAERNMLRGRVESNSTSAQIYCPVGAEIQVDLAWIHRVTVTRRQAVLSRSDGRP